MPHLERPSLRRQQPRQPKRLGLFRSFRRVCAAARPAALRASPLVLREVRVVAPLPLVVYCAARTRAAAALTTAHGSALA